MIIELRTKSQITLPKSIIEKIGLAVGDLLEISERDGVIVLQPVVVTPKISLEKRRAVLRSLIGSITDPSFVEAPEIEKESSREELL